MESEETRRGGEGVSFRRKGTSPEVVEGSGRLEEEEEEGRGWVIVGEDSVW